MSRYTSLGFTMGPSFDRPIGGIDWGVSDINISRETPDFDTDESDFDPGEMEVVGDKVIDDEYTDLGPSPDEMEEYASIQALSRIVYLDIVKAVGEGIKRNIKIEFREALKNQLIVVNGVLHIERLQAVVYGFLDRSLHSIGLLRGADIPSLAREISA